MNGLTPEQLKAIAERASRATEGPWQAHHWQITAGVNPSGDGLITLFRYTDSLAKPCQDDTVFVAHARTDIPLLLSHIAALESKAGFEEGVKAALEKCKEVGNFGDYKREELTADFGQPRFDLLTDIIAALALIPTPKVGETDA